MRVAGQIRRGIGDFLHDNEPAGRRLGFPAGNDRLNRAAPAFRQCRGHPQETIGGDRTRQRMAFTQIVWRATSAAWA